ncbi:MAG: sulfatase [Kiritimatiellae bacterium]|nr:sulfatase [Kiritimatiellia bacterium]
MGTQPNIIVFTSHDTGRHYGGYGVPSVHTPAIDRLAAAGVLCTNHFATCAMCSPSRCSVFTGLYPQNHGAMGLVHPPWGWSMRPDVRHLSHILRDAGYHTVLYGHQHETHGATHPEQPFGFESWNHWGGNKADRTADAFCEFLRSQPNDKRPFYAQVGFYEAHHPFTYEKDREKGVHVPPFLAPTDKTKDELARFQGSIRKLDEAVGRILDTLRETGREEDTLVVFTVDHGIPWPRAKQYLYDPGIETALILRWPAGPIPSGTRCDWLLSNIDIVPTLLDLIGTPAPADLDGISFAPFFRDRDAQPRRKELFAEMEHEAHQTRCVRTERFKLIRNFGSKRNPIVPCERGVKGKTPTPVEELYDLQADPNEFNDIAQDPAYAETKRGLNKRLWAFLERAHDPVLQGPMPHPYYEQAIADFRAAVLQ